MPVEASESAANGPQLRLCHIKKQFPEQEYGFDLRSGRHRDHFIDSIVIHSPADLGGLLVGDYIIAVNGVLVKGLQHRAIVTKIKENPLETHLLVIDLEGLKWYQERGIKLTIDSPNIKIVPAGNFAPHPGTDESTDDCVIVAVATKVLQYEGLVAVQSEQSVTGEGLTTHRRSTIERNLADSSQVGDVAPHPGADESYDDCVIVAVAKKVLQYEGPVAVQSEQTVTGGGLLTPHRHTMERDLADSPQIVAIFECSSPADPFSVLNLGFLSASGCQSPVADDSPVLLAQPPASSVRDKDVPTAASPEVVVIGEVLKRPEVVVIGEVLKRPEVVVIGEVLKRTAYAPPANFLEIEIVNPITHGVAKSRYTDYDVRMKTNLPVFKLKESSVRRRYSDFEWLRTELERDSTIILPPLPGKALQRQLPFRGDGGIFEEGFIEDRRKGLEQFVNKVAGHPLAQNEKSLHMFLQDPLIEKNYVPGKIRNI